MQIKNESLAKRCEICHQSDCFVAKLNHCSRCNGAKETAQVNVMANRKTPRRIFSDAFWRKMGKTPQTTQMSHRNDRELLGSNLTQNQRKR